MIFSNKRANSPWLIKQIGSCQHGYLGSPQAARSWPDICFNKKNNTRTDALYDKGYEWEHLYPRLAGGTLHTDAGRLQGVSTRQALHAKPEGEDSPYTSAALTGRPDISYRLPFPGPGISSAALPSLAGSLSNPWQPPL